MGSSTRTGQIFLTDGTIDEPVSTIVFPANTLSVTSPDEVTYTPGGAFNDFNEAAAPATPAAAKVRLYAKTDGLLYSKDDAGVETLVSGGVGGSAVTSVFGRTGAVIAATNDYTWAQINKATSSLADITTRSAGDLSSGTLLAARMPALTGDVTSSVGTVATTIAANAVTTAKILDNNVTLAKLADIATASFLGRNTAATGDPEVLSIATAKTMLNLTGTNSGDVTLAGETYLSIAGQVITANAVNLSGTHVTGTLAAGRFPALTGDVTNTAGSLATTIANNAVTLAKMADIATASLLGRTTAATGDPEVLSVSASRTLLQIDNVENVALSTWAGSTNITTVGNLAVHLIPATTDTYDLGSTTKLWRKGWLSELDAILFAQNVVTVIGGWLIVAKGEGTVAADVGTGDTTIDFGQAMTTGHIVLFRAAGQVEYVSVGSLVSGTTYNVTRDLDLTGANAWVAGTVYVILGTTGSGRIELNANSTPRISMITQGATYNAQTELLRIGDLNGSWGYASETYGFAVGQYNVAGKTSLTIDDTNGIRMFNVANQTAKFGTDGSILLGREAIGQKNILMTASGVIVLRDGTDEHVSIASDGTVTVGLASGSNVFITSTYLTLRSGSTQRIRLNADGSGFLASSNISWDTAGNANIAGWAVSVTSLVSGTGATTVGLDTGGTNPAIYAGSATPGSAPFRVTNAGALTSTSGNIGGWNITATEISKNGLALGANGVIYVGVGNWANANTGFYLDYTGLFSLKDRLTFNGTTLALTNSNIALGATPPTSASVGTGVWIDSTGLYGLLLDVVQAKLDATTGAITAGAGDVVLAASGMVIRNDGTDKTSSSIRFQNESDSVIDGFLKYRRVSGSPLIALHGDAPSSASDAQLQFQTNSDTASAHCEFFAAGSTASANAGLSFIRMGGNRGVMILRPYSSTSPGPSAVLELNSTTGAFILPRMTSTQRDALTASAGMLIYNTTTAKFQGYNGAWVDLH